MDPASVPDVSVPLKSALDLFIGFGADFFAFIVAAALIAAFAFYFGADRLMPFAAGLYAALPLYARFPYMEALGGNPYLEVALFAILVLVGTVAFSGLSYLLQSGGGGMLKTGALSVILAGFVLAIAVHVLPVSEFYTFSEPTRALFESEHAFFYWMLSPLAGLFLLGR